MTSPSTQHPSDIISQPFNLSQPPPSKRPTSTTPSDAQSQHAPPAGSPVSNLAQQDQAEAIRQGKQRARDIMAAQGVDVSADSAGNGSPNTRKRSRSGSPVEHKPGLLWEGKKMPIKDEYSRALLYRYEQRDALNDHYVRKTEYDMGHVVEKKRDELRDLANGYNRFKDSLHGRALMQNRDVKPMVIYPGDRKRAGNRRTEELRLTRKTARQQAECLEDLVPLRIDIELDKLRLRDTFTWNLHDRTVAPKLFADALVEDLQIPLESRDVVARQVREEIMEQLQNYYPQVWPASEAHEAGLPYWEHKNDDMRITIRLNITVGHITLVDQFEWDMNNPQNSAEDFAIQMAKDLSLSGEFTTAIAHSIREQTQMYTKSLYLTNYAFDGRLIEDPDIRDNMMSSPMHSIFRPHQMQKDYSPFLFELTEADLEKTELSMLREQRAAKRQLNRRGGPALPDLKDRPRTARSLVVSAVIPGAAETLEASGVLKIRRVSNRGGRRRITEDGSDSDDDDLEDSGPESPAPSTINIGTTARTRNMRGAASAAQAALRNSYGRSATPDFLQPEPRNTSRRSAAAESGREDTAEPSSLVVKLKLNPTKFRTWLARRKFGKSGAPPLSGFPTSMTKIEEKKPATPAKAPTTPALKHKTLPRDDSDSPSASETPDVRAPAGEVKYDANGRVDAETTPLAGDEAPKPPPWLTEAMSELAAKYPTSSFTALMRFSTLNAATSEPVRFDVSSLPPGSPPPSGPVTDPAGKVLADKVRFAYLPRIKCNDCPGKLYTAQRDGTAAAFEVHLKMRRHREAVEARLKRG